MSILFRSGDRASSFGEATGTTPRRGRLRLWPLVLFGIFAAVFYFGNQEIVPETGRKHLVSIDPRTEQALGLQSYRMILQQERVVETGPDVERVRLIGRRIASVISSDPGFQWEFNLVESPQANAFCLPGGKVAVYTGILPVARNDAGLAAVMGHEIAHAVARHGAERMAHQQLLQLGGLAVGAAVGDMDDSKQRAILAAFGVGAQVGVMLPFSREHELEADHIGLLYMARACFDPEEAPRLWERMAAAGGGAANEFLSTHPNPDTRIRQLNEWMMEAKAEYAARCVGK